MNGAKDMMPLSPWKLALAAFAGGLVGSATLHGPAQALATLLPLPS